MSDQAAYTKYGGNYPGYINAKPDGKGMVTVTLRGDPKEDGTEGPTATIVLATVDWMGFMNSVQNCEALRFQ